MRLFLTISIISWTEARFYLTELDITSQSPPADIAPLDITPADFASDYSDTADYSNQGKTKHLGFSIISREEVEVVKKAMGKVLTEVEESLPREARNLMVMAPYVRNLLEGIETFMDKYQE